MAVSNIPFGDIAVFDPCLLYTSKRTPAKAENAQSFLQVDRHGDVLDNFFKNFVRQCKEPSRFVFYRIAADQAENLLVSWCLPTVR